MIHDLTCRIRAIFGRRRMENELAEELEFHFERQVAVLVERGCPPEEARRRARLLFGGLDQVKEECRDARGISLLDTLWQDIRYAARLLARTPGFAATAVLSMAVGVGSITLAFWLLGQVAYRSLPVSAPEQLVSLRRSGPRPGDGGGDESALFSYRMFRDLRDRNTVFSAVVAHSDQFADLTYRQRTERVSLGLVSGGYFELLGVKPAAGRWFGQGDKGPGAPPVAVLSHSYWVRRFASDPAVVGQTILLNALPVAIAGVSAQGFDSLLPGRAPDVLAPIGIAVVPARDHSWINIVVRLKPGITRQRAQEELAPLYRQLIQSEAATLPVTWPGRRQLLSGRLELIPAGRDIGPATSLFMASLTAIAACILLAACANLAGLCLARAAARQQELAIRAALGASRGRVARQLLTEFLLPAAAGGLLGMLIALAVAGAVPRLLFDEERARTVAAVPSAHVLLLALAVSAAVVLLFGAVPALLPALGRPLRAINAGNIGPLGLSQATFRKVLVTAQVAFSAGLLFGAFTFSSELLTENRRRHTPGKRSEIAFRIDAGARGYDSSRAARLFQHLNQKLSALQGVRGAGFWDGGDWQFEVEGRQSMAPVQDRCLWRKVSPGFFNAVGFSLVEGRELGPAGEWPPRAVVVNETFERRIFAGHSPLGRHLRPFGSDRWAEVIGVVRDREPAGFVSPVPSIYVPYAGATSVAYVVQTLRPPETMLSAVMELIGKEAPGMQPPKLNTIDAQYAETFRSQRVLAAILCVFGVLTTALAVVGVYGVTAYVVTRRRFEIGVRMALGATAASVVRKVMKEVLWMIASGAAAGVILTVVACTLLFKPGSGPIWGDVYPELAAGTMVAAAAAGLAGLQAALRAARIDPATALRG